ncbi:hypothetical protein PC121_g11257 [Phytophthora cactorum]|nr:hypothetical protein PC120_g23103 [Phytophthora cactorum]KAG3065653.1 hypothetical protein PC121_g11257 [Phytophthora cactorum]
MFGGPATFFEYVSPRFDDFSQAIGASSDGRCAFHALSHAVRLFGRSDWFSMLTVDAFYNERTQAGNPIYATGVMWTTVWAFIRRNNRLARVSGGSEICEDTVSVNRTQFRLTGVQTCVGLDHLLLAPGVYICVGSVAGPPGKSPPLRWR